MSLTIEFYSANLQEIVALFTENPPSADDSILFDVLQTYPMAEFPGRLLIPDDLDSLCEALREYHLIIPSHFQEICVNEVWNDGFGTEALTILSDQFVHELATFNENEIQDVAFRWTTTFRLQEPLSESLPYRAVLQLHEIAQDAVKRGKSLFFYLVGAPGFFNYLRDL